MLEPHIIDIFKQSAPLLARSVDDITPAFYGRLFGEHPEVRVYFNQSHQRDGSQPRALARGLVAFAQNIENLGALAGFVTRVANKHVSLNVQPEHYGAIGSSLLATIREVLGPIVRDLDIEMDDVIDAWGQAYGVLAKILIQSEEDLYRDKEGREGGWRGTRRLRVARKVAESEIITSFYLEPTDGRPLVSFQPGQYLGLRLDIAGSEVRRNYSLSDAPSPDHYRISIKREPEGLVSSHMHDRVAIGDEIDVYPPCGDMGVVENSKPLVLVTAGVGITPAMSILESVVRSGRPVAFLHAAENSRVHAFRARIEELAAEHDHLTHGFFYSQPIVGDQPNHVGRLDRELLARYLPDDGDVELYTIGPVAFMSAVCRHAAELGVPGDQVHYEFFGPAKELAGEADGEETGGHPAQRAEGAASPAA